MNDTCEHKYIEKIRKNKFKKDVCIYCNQLRSTIEKYKLVNPDLCGSGKLIGRNYPEDYFG